MGIILFSWGKIWEIMFSRVKDGLFYKRSKERIKVGETEDVPSASATPSPVPEHGNIINSIG